MYAEYPDNNFGRDYKIISYRYRIGLLARKGYACLHFEPLRRI